MPHLDGKKDRCKCFKCGALWDIYDLLVALFPSEKYPHRKERVRQLEMDFKREGAAGASILAHVQGAAEPAPISQNPRGPTRSMEPKPDTGSADPGNVALAWANATEGEREVLAAAVGIAQRHGVDVEAFAYYAWHAAEWVRETNAEHLASCDDPHCDARVCVAARQENRRHDAECRKKVSAK
jgi:hypothetical protein